MCDHPEDERRLAEIDRCSTIARWTTWNAALHRAAGLIADYRRDAADARVGPEVGPRGRRMRALDPTLPAGPTPIDAVIDELVASAAPGLMGSAGPRYFGFVVGGSLDAGARRRSAHLGLGPERLQRRALARSARVRGRRRLVAEAAARPAGLGVCGVRDRCRRRQHGRPGSRPVARARRTRAGTPTATGSSERRGCESWRASSGTRRSTGRSACSGSATVDRRRCPRRRTGRWTPMRWPRRSRPAPRPDDRLRAGGQREHGSLRRPEGDRRRRPRARGMAPRGRRVRALGRRERQDRRARRRASSSPTRGDATGTSG